VDMVKHLKFTDGKQKIFINKIIKISNLSVKTIATFVNISPRNFRDWRNEKLSISSKAALLLSSKFKVKLPEPMSVMETRWIKHKSDIGRKGGLVYKSKYGNPSTIEGRRKGGSKTLSILRQKGIIPPISIFKKPRYSKRLAEFIGVMLGDGSIGNKQISITLNSIKDLEYSHYVARLCDQLFGKNPKIRKRKNANALEIYLSGINLIKILVEFGLVPGNKVKHQVDVPAWIKTRNEYKLMCLRGLMDTDGGIFIHRYKVNGRKYFYKKICFTNYSSNLLNFVFNTLNELGFTPKIKDKVVNKKVWLYNSHEVERYLSLVKSSNIRLNRFKYGGVA
jgi:hypothetical protein